MKRYVMMAALLLTVGALPLLAQAPQGRGGRMGGGPGMMMPFGPMLRGLNLTDAQRQQIHALMQEQQPAAPKTADIQRKLHEAILNGDASAIEGLKAELNAAHAEQLDQHIAMMQKIAQILTPEQKQQLLQAPPPGRGRGRGRGR